MIITPVAENVRGASEHLFHSIKDTMDAVTLSDSRQAYRLIREAESWLIAARRLLDPTLPAAPESSAPENQS